jgi:hypothetical protein
MYRDSPLQQGILKPTAKKSKNNPCSKTNTGLNDDQSLKRGGTERKIYGVISRPSSRDRCPGSNQSSPATQHEPGTGPIGPVEERRIFPERRSKSIVCIKLAS